MKKIYEAEDLKVKPVIITLIIVLLFIMIVSFRPLDPDFELVGFLVTFVFMIIFCTVVFLVACFSDIINYRKFIKYRNRVILNGIKIKGNIIESEQEVRVFINNVPTKYKYIAFIQIEDGTVFKTPYLLIDPDKLTNKEVTVYKNGNEFFATDFSYDDNIEEKETIKEFFKKINSYDFHILNRKECVASLIIGSLLMTVMLFFMISSNNNIWIVFFPFFITSVGIFLQGLLSLVMCNKILASKISKRIQMSGLLIYIFGFLIIWDYYTIKDNQIILFVFSLIFWAAGIYLLIRYFIDIK